MVQDLVLLGLLKDGPKHGYEIKKLVKRLSNTFTNIETTSIYYPLRDLEKRGLVRKSVGRKGKRPERYIYRLTENGDQKFNDLLSKNFLILQRPFLNIDLSLYFLPMVKRGLAVRRLRNRLSNLEKIKGWAQSLKRSLEKEKRPFHLVAICQHTIDILKTEIKFTSNLIENLGKVKVSS